MNLYQPGDTPKGKQKTDTKRLLEEQWNRGLHLQYLTSTFYFNKQTGPLFPSTNKAMGYSQVLCSLRDVILGVCRDSLFFAPLYILLIKSNPVPSFNTTHEGSPNTHQPTHSCLDVASPNSKPGVFLGLFLSHKLRVNCGTELLAIQSWNVAILFSSSALPILAATCLKVLLFSFVIYLCGPEGSQLTLSLSVAFHQPVRDIFHPQQTQI